MDYTPQLGQVICDAHAGGQTLGGIAKMQGMPTRADMYHWMATVPEFRNAMQQASKMFCHGLLDDVIDIADGDDDARERQMRINTRMAVAAKYVHALYGDDETQNVKALTDEEIDAFIEDFYARFTPS